MPPKCRRASTKNNVDERTCNAESAPSHESTPADYLTTLTQQTTFDMAQASTEQLNLFTMAFLRSRCQVCSLPSLGNKSALIKRLHEHFHPPSNDQSEHDASNNPTAPSTGNNPTTSRTQQRAGDVAISHPNPDQQERTQQRVGNALTSHSNHSQQTHNSDNSSVSLP